MIADVGGYLLGQVENFAADNLRGDSLIADCDPMVAVAHCVVDNCRGHY